MSSPADGKFTAMLVGGALQPFATGRSEFHGQCCGVIGVRLMGQHLTDQRSEAVKPEKIGWVQLWHPFWMATSIDVFGWTDRMNMRTYQNCLWIAHELADFLPDAVQHQFQWAHNTPRASEPRHGHRQILWCGLSAVPGRILCGLCLFVCLLVRLLVCLIACMFVRLFLLVRSFVGSFGGSLVGRSVRLSVRLSVRSFVRFLVRLWVLCLVGWLLIPVSHDLPFADRWLWNREGLRWCMTLRPWCGFTSQGRRRSRPYVVATSMTYQKRAEGFQSQLFHSLISIQKDCHGCHRSQHSHRCPVYSIFWQGWTDDRVLFVVACAAFGVGFWLRTLCPMPMPWIYINKNIYIYVL